MTSRKHDAELPNLERRLPLLPCDTVHVGNFVMLTRNGFVLEPDELPGVVNLLPYRDPKGKSSEIVTPVPRNIERLFDKRNAPWCFLCLRPLAFRDVTKAHILPGIFRKSYGFARYKARRKTPAAREFSVLLPLRDMFVYLCERCRRQEKKLDDVWTNVLKTPLPFSHREICHPDGTGISRNGPGWKMSLSPYGGLPNANIHFVITSPQPMLIMVAKLKASYFLKVFTTLILRGAAPDQMRTGLGNWPARRMIVEWMRKPKVDPELISYEVSRRPFPEPRKSLNWIQRSAAARIPRGATLHPRVPSGLQKRLAKAQFIVSLIPTCYVGHR